jgi:carboxypeptidase T
MKIKRQKNFIVLIGLVSLLVLLKLVAGRSTLTRAHMSAQTNEKSAGSEYGVSYGDDLTPSMIDSRQSLPPTPVPGQLSEAPQVIRLTYADSTAKSDEAQASLNQLAAWLDIWHVDPDTRTLTALVWPEEYAALVNAGYHVEVDTQRTIQILAPPGYPCYRTVEELYATLAQTITLNYPDITELVDYGDSWEKALPGGEDGYELYALEITNKAIPGPKPVALIDGGIHARELAPPEVAMALIEYLTTNYDQDPDVTWLVDYHKIVIPPMLNPDGHKKAEIGLWWRKNTDNDDGCSDPGQWGTDLNRNFYFKWGCCGGSSADACQVTYRGPSPDSEPEIYSYEDYVRSHIPDQWDYSDTLTVPAPFTTTGILVDMHSYDPSILYPWGWTDDNAPNDTHLKAIAEKYGSLSGYPVKRGLYRVDGSSSDWGYGDLGIPAFIVELGTDFFQDCSDLPGIIADNLPPLFYFIRIARTPYMLVHGPDVSNITLTPSATVTAPPVQLSATISDAQNGGQTIAAAVYYVDVPPWITATSAVSYPMTAVDGTFDATVEEVQAELDIHNLSTGRHTIFIQGQDADGNWGPFWATWLTVTQAWIIGDVVDAQTDAAISAANLSMANPPWTYTVQTDLSGNFARELVSGTYSITATAQGYYSTTVEGIVAQSGVTTSLHIRMDAFMTYYYLPIVVKDFTTLP